MSQLFYIVFLLLVGLNPGSHEESDEVTHPITTEDASTNEDPGPGAKVKQLPIPMQSPLAKAMMPMLSATKTFAQFGLDVGPAGPSPGDSLRYEVIISNAMGAMDALNVNFTDQVDPNTTLIPTSINSSPIAVDDSYATVGNVSISVPAASGLLSNDIELDGDLLQVTAINTMDTDGNVTFTANGSFTFNPAPGFEGTTTFEYTVTDGVFNVTGTVSIEVSGMIWFINAAAPAGGDGRLNSPYNTIAGYNTLAPDGINDNIFIYTGSYTGGITMLNGQKVIGQGAMESLNAITGLSAPAFPPISPGVLPSTGGANPTMSGSATVLSLASNNEVYGLTINNTTNTSISGANVGNLKVRNVSISNSSGPALNISNGVLDVIISSITVSNATFGVRVTNTTGLIQVPGTGTTGGSGGTFTNIVQRGIELNNVTNATLRNINMNSANTGDAGFAGVCDEQNNIGCFAAIYLRDANGVTLNNINITGTEEHGINGNNVNNLSVVNCTVTQNGNADEENALKFRNLTGTCTFMNSTFSLSAFRISHIINTTGTLTLNVSGCTFNNTIGSAVGQDCFEVRTFNSAVATINLSNCNFWRARTKAIQAIAEGSSTMNININNCRVERFGGNMAGIDVGSVGSATINYNIVNNPVIESAVEVAVLASTFETSNLNGRVNNNSGINHSPASETVFANVRVLHEMNSVARIEMINNQGVNSTGTAQGVLAISRVGTTAASRLDFTLDGNTISNTMNSLIEGIELRVGQSTSPAETSTLCGNVRNNNVTVPANTRAFRARIVNPSGTMNLQGPGPDVMSNWTGNSNVNSVPSNIVGFFTAGSTITFGGTCNLPAHAAAPLMSEISEMISRSQDVIELTDPDLQISEMLAGKSKAITGATTEEYYTEEVIPWVSTSPQLSMMPMTGLVSYSNFTLPAGKELTIRFDVTINDPFPTGVCEVSNQGTISGSNFTTFSTDDPSAPGTSDPTITTLNIAAEILSCQENISVNTDPGLCNASVAFSTSVNGCPEPTVTYSIGANTITSPHVFPVGATTVSVLVSNGIGMDTTCTFNVTVTDIEAPTAVCNDVTRQVNIDREASIEVIDINNGSMDVCGISTISLSKELFTCMDLGMNIVIMTVTDINNNTNTCTSVVTILDDDNPCCDPPVANCTAAVTVFLDSLGLYMLSAAEVDSNSVADCGIQSLDVSPNLLNCSNIGAGVTVTLTVTDNNNNMATCTSTITVLDTIAPVAICQNINANLAADGTVTVVGESVDNNSTDACGIDTYSLTPNMFTCSDRGPNMVVLTVTDANDNVSSCSATITILDVTPPTPPSPPSDITIACVEDLPAAPMLTASDVCDGDITASGIDTDNGGVGCMLGPLVITRTWTFTDTSDNTSTSVQTITVIDSIPPVFITEAMDRIVECDGAGNNSELQIWLNNHAAAEVTDNCNSNITWTNNYNPSNFISACGMTGTVDVVFTATDECGNASQSTASFTIEDKTPPTIINPAMDITVECDGSGNNSELQAWLDSQGNALASDACSEPIEWTNNYSPTNIIEGCGSTGSVEVVFTATDDCGNLSQTTATFTIEDTTTPVIDTLASNMTVECDGEGNTTALQTWLDNQGNASATDFCSGSVTWTNNYNPANFVSGCGLTGSVEVVFTATDDCGFTSQTTATFTIEDTTPPTITSGAMNLTVECDGEGNTAELQAWLDAQANAMANDACSEPIVWSNNYIPNNFVAACGFSGSVTVLFAATDDCGNSSVTTATFTIEDTVGPSIDVAASDSTVECDGSGNTTQLQAWLDSNGGAVASDACSSDLQWTNDYMASNFVSSCGSAGEVEVTFTATDDCGEFSETTARFIIIDTTNPDIGTLSQDLTVECDGSGNNTELQAWLDSQGNAMASDICSGPVEWTNDYSPMNFVEGCGATGSVEVVFTATDDCGNSSQTTSTFTIEDTAAPEIDTLASNMTVECDGEGNTAALQTWLANQGNASASDFCSGSVTWTNNYNPANFVSGCGLTGSVEVVFTASDDCGLTSQTTATFTIEDTTPPTITSGAMNLTVECDGEGNTAELQAWLNAQADAIATDACSEPIVWTNDYNPNNFVAGCGFSGSVSVLFTATDDCGNFAETTATFTIEDTVGPSIDIAASDSTVECDGSGNTTQLQAWLDSNGGAVASDACSADLQWTNDYMASNFIASCGSTGEVEVTFTVTDDCNQISVTTAKFIIADTTPPDITTLPQDLTVECDGSGNTAQFNSWLASQGGAEASDLCSSFIWETLPENPVIMEACGGTGASTVSFVAVDDCDNSSSATVTFTIEDTTPPTVVCENTTVVLQEEGEYQLLDSDVLDFSASSDTCDPNLEVISIFPAMVDCNNLNEPVEVLVTVADACGNESNCMSTITVLQGDALPGGFMQNFIGNVTGDAIFEPCKVDGTFTISSTGFTTSTSDRQNFVSQTLCGNGEIFARIVSVNNSGFAGVQMRENLTPGSRKAVLKTQLNYFIRREIRVNQNGPSQSQQLFRPQNMWLRLVRNGNTFTGFTSPDGASWNFAFAANVPMNNCIHMGLISESINNTTLVTAEFDQVSTMGAGLGSPDPQSQITNVTEITLYPNPTNGQVMLQWPQSMKYEKAEIFIYNNIGQIMHKDVVTHGHEKILNLTMPAGIYHVNVLLDNEVPMVKRLVIH